MKFNLRIIKIIIVALVVLIGGFLLITGNAILHFPILKEPYVPAGTLISWVVLISFPYLFVALSKRSTPMSRGLKIFRIVVKFALGMGILWGFVSYFLSGNWNYVFTNEKRAMIWIIYTVLIVLLPILSLLIFLLVRGIQKVVKVIRK